MTSRLPDATTTVARRVRQGHLGMTSRLPDATTTVARRVRRQQLLPRTTGDGLLDVTGAIGGLHAQVMSSAEFTAWARTDGLDRDAVQRALWEERTLVKTWAMRGTLHLLPADELPLWIAALGTAPRLWERPSWTKYFEVTREQLEELFAAVAKVLDGAVLTREEIADAVGDETGSAAQRDKLLSGWGTLLKPVARLGLLCYGPDRGRNVTFTRPDTWLGGWREVDPDEATAEVTRRYLAANGPASRDEYARWFGTTAAHAGRMLQALGDEAMEVEHDGGREWVLAADLDAAEEPVDGVVRLLPRFDQWTVGLPRADDVAVTPDVRDRIYREAGWIWAVVLAGGRAAGIWEHDVKASTVELRVEPFTKLPRRTLDAIEVEAQRLADWLDLTLDLTIVA